MNSDHIPDAPTPAAASYEAACAKVREAFRNERTPTQEDYDAARAIVDARPSPWSLNSGTGVICRQNAIESEAVRQRDARLAAPARKAAA
jgi:hypothetical protein